MSEPARAGLALLLALGLEVCDLGLLHHDLLARLRLGVRAGLRGLRHGAIALGLVAGQLGAGA